MPIQNILFISIIHIALLAQEKTDFFIDFNNNLIITKKVKVF